MNDHGSDMCYGSAQSQESHFTEKYALERKLSFYLFGFDIEFIKFMK